MSSIPPITSAPQDSPNTAKRKRQEKFQKLRESIGSGLKGAFRAPIPQNTRPEKPLGKKWPKVEVKTSDIQENQTSPPQTTTETPSSTNPKEQAPQMSPENRMKLLAIGKRTEELLEQTIKALRKSSTTARRKRLITVTAFIGAGLLLIGGFTYLRKSSQRAKVMKDSSAGR